MDRVFKTKGGELALPVFFPDATRAVLRTLDSLDIANTQTQGVLVNTWHLYNGVGKKIIKSHGGVRGFMNWKGALISDSGGFQVMSIAKNEYKNAVCDSGVYFKNQKGKKELFTPEDSIEFQFLLEPDMVVVLDDFTPPSANRFEAEVTVTRTINWARRSKDEFEKQCKKRGLDNNNRPHLLAVVQGGEYLDLRKECAHKLAEIGFDGFGYGGWPIKQDGSFNYEVAEVIADCAPPNYFLYGLGVGKPEEVVALARLGYGIFDCVLPTRDARHGRLYRYNAENIAEIDINKPNFYSYYVPTKEMHYNSTEPVSTACDCLLCKNYTRSYLAHLFRMKEITAMRLATIHNLRFYSILMEKLRESAKS